MSRSSPSLSRFSRFGRHSRSLTVTGTFLRRQLWVWPLIAAVLLALLSWWVMGAVEGVMRRQVAAELTAIRDADVTALRVWMRQQEAEREADGDVGPHTSGDDRARRACRFRRGVAAVSAAGRAAGVFGAADENPGLHRFLCLVTVAETDCLLAGGDDRPVLNGYRGELVDKALKTGALVSRPFRSPFLYPDEKGELRADRPTIVAGSRGSRQPGASAGSAQFPHPAGRRVHADPADGTIGADGRDVRLRRKRACC